MQHGSNISHQMEYLLATGNLVSRSGLGLMQVTDYHQCFVYLMILLRTPHLNVYMYFFHLLLEANKYP